jgi:alkylated DNA nucleotide flippase Atl1
VPPSPDVILDRVRRVPPGFVTTYGDLSPGAPRLAGRVLSGLPDGHDVPWWRVVRSDGSLAVGARQRELLLEEDVPWRGARVDLAAARIPPEAIL